MEYKLELKFKKFNSDEPVAGHCGICGVASLLVGDVPRKDKRLSNVECAYDQVVGVK
jgi:hypothetical protein